MLVTFLDLREAFHIRSTGEKRRDIGGQQNQSEYTLLSTQKLLCVLCNDGVKYSLRKR